MTGTKIKAASEINQPEEEKHRLRNLKNMKLRLMSLNHKDRKISKVLPREKKLRLNIPPLEKIKARVYTVCNIIAM